MKTKGKGKRTNACQCITAVLDGKIILMDRSLDAISYARAVCDRLANFLLDIISQISYSSSSSSSSSSFCLACLSRIE